MNKKNQSNNVNPYDLLQVHKMKNKAKIKEEKKYDVSPYDTVKFQQNVKEFLRKF